MIVRGQKDCKVVECPKGGFLSNRYLLGKDNLGFSLTKTVIPVGEVQNWHYKNHLEACLCIEGEGILTDVETSKEYHIKKDVMYALDKNDNHLFKATKECVLICVFNPPLTGNEVHKKDNSY